VIGQVSRGVREQYPSALGLVLTGSTSRGEETLLPTADGCRWLSDLELLVVVPGDVNRVSEGDLLDLLASQISAQLQRDGVTVEVELTPVQEHYFSRMRPHIFGYELLMNGKQLFGEREYLSLLPKMHAWDIPDEDAWRLLSNRMVEWLALQVNAGSEAADAQFYRIAKQYLDLVTALSLFCGRYAPSYEGRRESVLAICEWMQQRISSFPSRDFMQFAETAFEFKVRPENAKFQWLQRTGVSKFRAAAGQAGFGPMIDGLPQLLSMAWWAALSEMQEGSVRSREGALSALVQVYGWEGLVRGWGKMILRPESHADGAFYSRVPRLLWLGSPRSLVYVCAAQLLEAHGKEDDNTLGWVRSRLPVLYGPKQADWRSLAQQCIWNWERHLRRGYV
jgi:hypothetical protein